MNFVRTTIVLIVAALAATIAFQSVPAAEQAAQRRIVVEIRKLKFVPQSLAVRAGDIVVWRNKDIVPHTATSKDDSWDSGAIEAGGEREVLVIEGMSKDYFCQFHPTMVATLDVKAK